MNNRDKPKVQPAGAIAVIVVVAILSPLLHWLAPLVGAIVGVFGASWVVAILGEKDKGIPFVVSVILWPAIAILIAGSFTALLALPMWILATFSGDYSLWVPWRDW